MKYQQLAKSGLGLLYFASYILTTVPAQLLLIFLFLMQPRVPRKVAFYLIFCIIYFVGIIAINPSVIPLRNMFFYFSFVMPFLIMLSTRNRVNYFTITEKFMVVVCTVTVVEAIIINSPLGTNIWFLPANHVHRVLMFNGLYQRPLGISGVASSSAALIVFSLVLSDVFKEKWRFLSKKNILAILALIVLASGTGFVLFMIYLIMKLFSNVFSIQRMGLVVKIAVFSFVGVLFLGASSNLFLADGFNKFSFVYVSYIFQNKVMSFESLQLASLVEVLFGGQISQENPVFATASDFGYLSMFNAIGIFGSLLVLSAPLLFSRSIRFFIIPTIFFYMCFLHYPALLSPPGAVLFALYLYILSTHRIINR